MRILFLGKRFYTGRDTLLDKFGRIYQFPRNWSARNNEVLLYLFDYRTPGTRNASHGFQIRSVSPLDPRMYFDVLTLSRDFRPDVIVASGDCFIGIFASWLAKRCKAAFAFDVYDDYRSFGGYRAFLGFDAYNHLMRRASLVIYASSALAERHRWESPTHVAPNGVDPKKFRPMDLHEARAEIGLAQESKWIGYFGGMNLDRGVADLVAAVGKLNRKDDRIRLLLCDHAVEGVQLDYPWIDYRGNVPHECIPRYINACDVVTIPYRRAPGIDMASSCKIAEYLFCKRPIVATKTPNLLINFPIQATALGAALCNPGDVPDLARALAHQIENGVVVDVPEEHTWQSISNEALRALRKAIALDNHD